MEKLALLFATLLISSTQAAEPAVIFDKTILDFDQFKPSQTAARTLSNSAGNILKLVEDALPPSVAKKILRARLVQLEMLFAPHGAPYPGMLTKDASCVKNAVLAKKIEETQDSIFWFSEMPATNGLIYGACGSMDEPYWSQQLLLYCKDKKTLHDIRYFKPRNKGTERIGKPLASCAHGSP